MALSLERYDREVGFHLKAIRQHADEIVQHVGKMSCQPDFEAWAESEVVACIDTLAHALRQVSRALERYREKPRDGAER